MSDIFLKGSPEELFGADERFRAKIREVISNALEERVDWGRGE
jgi:hypothetical protein